MPLSRRISKGYIYITQLAVKQMLAQKSGGSVVGITSSLVENPIGGLPVSLPMITKGGLDAITVSLAIGVCEGAHPLQCGRTWRC